MHGTNSSKRSLIKRSSRRPSVLRKHEALNIAKTESIGDTHSSETRQHIGGQNHGDLIHRIRVSSRSPSHCPCIVCTLFMQLALGLDKGVGSFFNGIFHFLTDGRRSTVCGARVSLMSLRTRSFEMQDDHNEIRDFPKFLFF